LSGPRMNVMLPLCFGGGCSFRLKFDVTDQVSGKSIPCDSHCEMSVTEAAQVCFGFSCDCGLSRRRDRLTNGRTPITDFVNSARCKSISIFQPCAGAAALHEIDRISNAIVDRVLPADHDAIGIVLRRNLDALSGDSAPGHIPINTKGHKGRPPLAIPSSSARRNLWPASP